MDSQSLIEQTVAAQARARIRALERSQPALDWLIRAMQRTRAHTEPGTETEHNDALGLDSDVQA